jgi:hypothetical protein
MYCSYHPDPYTLVTTSTFGATNIYWNLFYYNIVFTYPKASIDYRMGVSIFQLNFVIASSRGLSYQVDLDGATKTISGVSMTLYSY